MFRLCLLVVPLVLCIATYSDDDGAAHDSNRIRIRIDQHGGRVCDSQTRVSLVSSAGPVTVEGPTNAQCVAEFFDVPAGNYHAVANGPGISGSREIEIDANQTQELDLPVVNLDGHAKAAGGATVSAHEFSVPHNARKKYDAAIRLMDKNDLPKALAQLQKAIEIAPNYAEAYNDLGVVYGRMGNKVESRAALERAIQWNDRLAPAYRNLALMDVSDRNFPDAEKLLEKAASAGVNDAPTLILLAGVELVDQHYDQALANCRKAHSMPQTHHATAHYIAAQAYEHENRPGAALAELRMLLTEEQTGARADAARKEIIGLQAVVH